MRIHNVYENANGESHFRDIEVDWVEETPTGKLSNRLPATDIMFRETHHGLRKQLAPGAPPAICDQSGGRDLDHRQRRRGAPYRPRRDRPGRRHNRQGPHY